MYPIGQYKFTISRKQSIIMKSEPKYEGIYNAFTWLVDAKAEDVDDDGPPFSHWNAVEVEAPPWQKRRHSIMQLPRLDFQGGFCSVTPTSVCWIACEAAVAILWLSLASSTFSVMSGRSCFSSSSSVFSSLASPAPSAELMASCNMAFFCTKQI